jgi:hypothetical protein
MRPVHMLMVHFDKLATQPDPTFCRIISQVNRSDPPLSHRQLPIIINMSTTTRRLLTLMIGIGIAICIVLKIVIDGLN